MKKFHVSNVKIHPIHRTNKTLFTKIVSKMIYKNEIYC